MSWLSKAWRDVTGETAQREGQRLRDNERRRKRMIGPDPGGDEITAALMSNMSAETIEERKRRLRRMASILDAGGDMYGDLTLGKRGLLSQ